jgi:predicted nucleic acid-binding protein
MYYVDTSVVLAAVLDGSMAVASWMQHCSQAGIPMVSSKFLWVEAHHVVKVRGGDPALLTVYLRRIGTMSIDDDLMDEAVALRGPIRGADAVHVASALRAAGATLLFCTHDRQQAAAASGERLTVADPGTDDPAGAVASPPPGGQS